MCDQYFEEEVEGFGLWDSFLQYGLCQKIFIVCCMFHIDIFSELGTKDSDVRVGHGAPFLGDGMWLRGGNGRSFPPKDDNKSLAEL